MLKLEAKLLDNSLSQKLLKKEQAARKAMSYTMKDLKRRAPTKVAQAVVDVYAVKQGDVKPGKGGAMYRTYMMLKGSSEYNTKEMSHLIDGLVSECKEMGIETLPPEELERMMSEYEKRYKKRTAG